MSSTKTEASVNDSRMWRRLLACAHPDQGGDHELFLWAQAVREEIESPTPVAAGLGASFGFGMYTSSRPTSPAPRRKPRPKDRSAPENRSQERVAFDTDLTFDEITARAIELADGLSAESYGRIMRLLEGYSHPAGNPDLESEAATGAAYWRLADIGHAFDLDGYGRGGLYKIARDAPLSGCHARYLLAEVQRLVEQSPEVVAEIRESVPSQKG